MDPSHDGSGQDFRFNHVEVGVRVDFLVLFLRCSIVVSGKKLVS